MYSVDRWYINATGAFVDMQQTTATTETMPDNSSFHKDLKIIEKASNSGLAVGQRIKAMIGLPQCLRYSLRLQILVHHP